MLMLVDSSRLKNEELNLDGVYQDKMQAGHDRAAVVQFSGAKSVDKGSRSDPAGMRS